MSVVSLYRGTLTDPSLTWAFQVAFHRWNSASEFERLCPHYAIYATNDRSPLPTKVWFRGFSCHFDSDFILSYFFQPSKSITDYKQPFAMPACRAYRLPRTRGEFINYSTFWNPDESAISNAHFFSKLIVWGFSASRTSSNLHQIQVASKQPTSNLSNHLHLRPIYTQGNVTKQFIVICN